MADSYSSDYWKNSSWKIKLYITLIITYDFWSVFCRPLSVVCWSVLALGSWFCFKETFKSLTTFWSVFDLCSVSKKRSKVWRRFEVSLTFALFQRNVQKSSTFWSVFVLCSASKKRSKVWRRFEVSLFFALCSN